jgi:hypothetical protein
MGCIISKSLCSTIIKKIKYPIIKLPKKSYEIIVDSEIQLNEIIVDPEIQLNEISGYTVIQLSEKSNEITLYADVALDCVESDSYSSCDFEIVTKYDL